MWTYLAWGTILNMRGYVDMLLIKSTANIKTWERDNGLYGGLSPLARGTRRERDSETPPGSVYPRWRGELALKRCQRHNKPGLSPLARGTPASPSQPPDITRFIPAGAGNSLLSVRHSLLPAVYPRWRGELRPRLTNFSSVVGLSPLARGTRPLNVSRRTGVRFIPAGAGNSQWFIPRPGQSGGYPRWRGELHFHSCGVIAVSGLSPLARGTL